MEIQATGRGATYQVSVKIFENKGAIVEAIYCHGGVSYIYYPRPDRGAAAWPAVLAEEPGEFNLEDICPPENAGWYSENE